MITLRKKILVGIAALVVMLIAGSYLFVFLYDFDRFKPTIARAVFEATARELRIEGHMDSKPALRPTLTAADVRFQNAPWGSRLDLATVKRIEVQLALLPMLSGDFDFVRVRLVEPDVTLEKDTTGSTHFEFESGGEAKAPAGSH
ncbi:MAG: AsmA family protein [Desulfatiglandaceae bacterium]